MPIFEFKIINGNQTMYLSFDSIDEGLAKIQKFDLILIYQDGKLVKTVAKQLDFEFL